MATKIDFSNLTLQDALDLAVLIEKEAEQRYRLFVSQLGHSYPGDAADFFAMMAKNEERHAARLLLRRTKLFSGAPLRMNADLLEDVEAPEIDRPRPHMSPRHALEVALASESKAYSFFDEALHYVKNPEVRELFAELRDEEAEHQRLLLALKSRYPDTFEPDLGPEDIDTPAL